MLLGAVRRVVGVVGVCLLALTGCSTADDASPQAGTTIADAPTETLGADGDLWPNCWADDDNIYAAHGDGKGLGSTFSDIGVERIEGPPDDLSGETLALGDDIGSTWSGPGFNRKPTGMACVQGTLYLAVQDLARDFNSAPAASVSVSTDHGRTWSWDETGPMFADGVFTTITFLDYGRDYQNAPDDYVYAYGLDGNWRDSFTDVVDDPVDMFLGRAPADSVADRSTWEFYSGLRDEQPIWSTEIGDKVAVLHDDRQLYTDASELVANDLTVISQGGVVYNEALDRYIYTSWTELTFEFYEAREPWGPFRLFFSEDWGPYPWTNERQGGYGLSIPSKFISSDGRSMWLQSNVCPCAPAGISTYDFSLRPFTVHLSDD
ncbi:MAG: DUF4185 domain-containing protein [Chloroflexi bacterium]|nr:DUF4185 domain-containing protein [Chloroflexota bacterium]